LSQFKKYHSSGSLKFNYLCIFPSLKLRILMEKICLISLKLNFTPNTIGLLHRKNGFVTATKFWTTNKILLLQPKILPQQPNVLLIELNILLL